MRTITCSVHGAQQETMVCQHVVQGLVDRQRVGFFWSVEAPDNPRPDAWCRACEQRIRSAGTCGESSGEALEQAQPKVLCGVCYDLAKTFHMGGDPWS